MNTNSGLLTENGLQISFIVRKYVFRATELTIFGTSRYGLLNMIFSFSSQRNCTTDKKDLTRRNEMIVAMCVISLPLFSKTLWIHLTPTESDHTKTALFLSNCGYSLFLL